MTEETRTGIGDAVRCPVCAGLSDGIARDDGDLTCSFCRVPGGDPDARKGAPKLSGVVAADAVLAILARLGRGPATLGDLRDAVAEASGKGRSPRTVEAMLGALGRAGFGVSPGPIYELRSHPLPDSGVLPAAYAAARELRGAREELRRAKRTREAATDRALGALDAVLDAFVGEAEGGEEAT